MNGSNQFHSERTPLYLFRLSLSLLPRSRDRLFLDLSRSDSRTLESFEPRSFTRSSLFGSSSFLLSRDFCVLSSRDLFSRDRSLRDFSSRDLEDFDETSLTGEIFLGVGDRLLDFLRFGLI